ncbi:MAG: DUF1598 domain-containing protein [Planctomycetota bacterium]
MSLPVQFQRVLGGLLVCAAAVSLSAAPAVAQVGGAFFGGGAVGGVSVDADGVVEAPSVEQQRELDRVRARVEADVPADLEAFTELRAVSLKKLQAAIADHQARGVELPDSVRFLAGLQRVQYVFVYPEQQDIVLAGPAEGWRLNEYGEVVGLTTGLPVVRLEDLVVALQTRSDSRMQPISCSIDPTAEGMRRYQSISRDLGRVNNRDRQLRMIEEAVGPQTITVTGVDQGTRFARTLVAADFRMKRLAMGFEPAPFAGMPSYMEMLSSKRGGAESATPRWWLAPSYEPLARDADGLSWELRGQGIKCLTETDHFNAQGQRERSVAAGPLAKRWADTFTERFDDLAAHDSAFGQLRNVVDLAVVAALLEKEQLIELAGLELSTLVGVETAAYPAPRTVATTANFVRQGRNTLVSASGGVQVLPWVVADSTEVSSTVAESRPAGLTSASGWWAE